MDHCMARLFSRITLMSGCLQTAVIRGSLFSYKSSVCQASQVRKRLDIYDTCRTRRTFTNRPPSHAQAPPAQPPDKDVHRDSSHGQPAANLSQKVTEEEKSHFRRVEEEHKERQRQSPWTRHGSQEPPVSQHKQASPSTKGKLLTTPSRMLKLIIPLMPSNGENLQTQKEIEPLALLVHPQQPLSYLERLIQSELPTLESGKPPGVVFRAEDSSENDHEDFKEDRPAARDETERDEYDIENPDETIVDGHKSRTGKIGGGSKALEASFDNAGEADKSHTSVKDPTHPNFVRWSPSTEIGDFIRDASRGKEFAVDVEGAPGPIYVTVPSFPDRTYYLRTRLRKTALQISQMAEVKHECDKLAHRGAKRVAQVGFGGLIGWWAIVFWLTFRTNLGWDVMEPVTYLVGLSGLIGGYMWFLYHNREVSYKSAMHVTVSRRQSQLYEQKGFNVSQWEGLIEEGNSLRREIKLIADEYDVEWDESKDEGDEKVKEALRKGRKKNGEKEKKSKDEDDGDEDD